MKIKYLLILQAFLFIMSHNTFAQQDQSQKTAFFRNSSERIPTKIHEIEKAFSVPQGSPIIMEFRNFTFEGVVTSSIKRYENLHTVIIKSAQLNNTLFSVAKRINDDKTISYTGRILNQKSADGYELIVDEDGGYILKKIQTDVLLQDF